MGYDSTWRLCYHELNENFSPQVSVFSKDLREAAEVGTGTNIVGNYELHDLVQIE